MTSGPVRVLLVEDDDDDFLLLRDWLAEAADPPFVVERVATYEAALVAMRRNAHDVYLLDYRLGKQDGLQLLREAADSCCTGPAILLTGQGHRDLDLEAMKAGAVDYLPKDRLTTFSLERAVRYAIERRRADEALRQSQKMEAVGRLAGGVAHDFNNLLTVINGYSELLIARLDKDDESRFLAEEVKKAGLRAAALTQQLLTFSRKQIISLRELNLNSIVADLEKMLCRVLGEDVELVTMLNSGAASIHADPAQVEQVVVNLAVNARDAMPRGGKLTIETRSVDLGSSPPWAHFKVQPGRYVRLAVSDTGCGMTEEVKAHLFEPFFTTKGVGKGTGLGLATVYGIIKQNNGYIIAESTPGHGSTFHVYFPAIDAAPAATAVPPQDVAELLPGKGTVLLVEDEAGVRQLVGLILRQRGYTVLEAANGMEAVLLSEHYRGPIDLLVTDVVMPLMGGRELVDRLARSRTQTKILYLSGYTEDGIVRHGVSHEGASFLQKPFSAHALARKVAEVLGQSHYSGSDERPNPQGDNHD